MEINELYVMIIVAVLSFSYLIGYVLSKSNNNYLLHEL